MIWVAIADDDAMVRSALRRYIESEPDLRCAGEAASAEEALVFLQTHHADVLALDLSMPGLGGLLALPRIRAVAPRVRTVVLTSHSEHRQRALDAGAADYLLKPVGGLDLAAAIRKAARLKDA